MAFDRVGNMKNFPESRRWQCTFKLSYRIPKLEERHLDDILEAVGLDRRRVGEPHDAISDATLCGMAYMKLVSLPDPKKPHLGFKKR